MNIVDFHNHLMPGVDDGAQTPEESAAALEALKADGVGAVITTPHVDGSVTISPRDREQRLAALDAAYVQLQHCAEQVGFEVARGVELLLDVPEPDLTDPRVRLAGGKFFLMEFPFMMVPPNSARAVKSLARSGFTPIIAHPERYADFENHLDLAGEWKQAGAYLQVNGGSLLGRYGAEARRNAFELLRRGWVDYICSDYHARGPTLVASYNALLETMGGLEQADTLMKTNPRRILSGQDPLPVMPLELRRTLWGRMTSIFR